MWRIYLYGYLGYSFNSSHLCCLLHSHAIKKKITSFIFLLSWAFVQSLIEDFSSILFLEHSVFKQNTGEVLYKDLYKGSTG